jgi:hypothetical protein
METEATLRRGGWRVCRDVAAEPGGSHPDSVRIHQATIAGARRRNAAAALVPGATIAPAADTAVARPDPGAAASA